WRLDRDHESVPVASPTLGLTGLGDVVEFTAAAEGVQLPGREGFYQPAPVEYKRGHKKHDHCDEAQLCAQAMCLEEMLATVIPAGFIYYAQTRHREPVAFTADLRDKVLKAVEEMHAYYRRGYTPKVKPFKGCRACSLVDICLPDLQSKRITAAKYIQQYVEEAHR
ncbi:MAG: CRISPR-associated protein Cas4, partial [Anaerolineales bacterium]|nr:CRISPR-associated protein Cas4 [Anaerolineales bacterium]